jgi:hypothetical protein
MRVDTAQLLGQSLDRALSFSAHDLPPASNPGPLRRHGVELCMMSAMFRELTFQ